MSQIKLLSGAVIDMRKLKTRDVDFILASKPRSFLNNLVATLEACTVEVLDSGIYSMPFNWRKVYEGDWFDALFQLRALSLGSDYTFEMRCTNTRCRCKQEVEYDLLTLERKAPSEAILERLRAHENRFDIPYSEGMIQILIPTAEETVAITNSKRSKTIAARKTDEDSATDADTTLIAALETKILKVTLADGTVFEGARKDAYLLDLDIDISGELLDLIEDYTFGVQLTLVIECSDCKETMEFSLPLAKTFFLKKRRT
jgi:hypothetical protein